MQKTINLFKGSIGLRSVSLNQGGISEITGNATYKDVTLPIVLSDAPLMVLPIDTVYGVSNIGFSYSLAYNRQASSKSSIRILFDKANAGEFGYVAFGRL